MHLTIVPRVLLTVLALAAGSLSLVASAQPAQAEPAARAAIGGTSPTTSHLKRDLSVLKYGSYVTFQGWVTCCGSSTPGFGGNVQLQRKVVGQTAWTNFSTRTLTDANRVQTWKFRPSASAYYRLHYTGAAAASPSYSVALTVTVRRNPNDHWRSSDRLFYGKVAPTYAGRVLYIQRTTCAYPRSSSCTWSGYKSIRTNRTSNWAVRLPAYARTTYFRAYLPGSNGYAGSYSNYLVSTRLG